MLASPATTLTVIVTAPAATRPGIPVRVQFTSEIRATHRLHPVVAWIHYLLSMCYDLLTLLISSYYLLGRQPCLYLSFSSMARVLLVDGLGYFVMLTAVNIVNLVFFKTAPTTALQTAASSLGYTVTMIGGQRILIHLRGKLRQSSGVKDGGSRGVHRRPRRQVAESHPQATSDGRQLRWRRL